MSKERLDFIEEIQLFVNFLLSAFSKKYKNEWLCLFAGLPLLFLYDHPYLIINILK
jgi:hypothetical protein